MNALNIKDCINTHCPNSGKPVAADSLMLYNADVVGFCNPGCRDTFKNAIRMFDRAKAKRL